MAWVAPTFDNFNDVFAHLRDDPWRDKNVLVKPGVTGSELAAVEERFHFHFPPDLMEFLSIGLPSGGRFRDWRDGAEKELLDQLGWPVEGLLFDVRNNVFWLPAWGERPTDSGAAVAHARECLHGIPSLIPIVGHRYLPSVPCEAGNSVLSVHQSDIVVYGDNLLEFLNNDLGRRIPAIDEAKFAKARSVPFWGELVE